MLILTRKKSESVVVGGYEQMLKVTVLEIRGARVKLGFEVDKDVPVHRWEVWERLQADGNGSPTLEDYRHDPPHEATGPVGLNIPNRQ